MIVTAQFMVVLDISIVNVALPSIQTDLGFSQENLQAITGYSIFFGGFSCSVDGSLICSDGGGCSWRGYPVHSQFAAQRARLVGRLPDRVPVLTGSRRAMMSPAALSILMTTFEEGRERNRALGVWGAVAGAVVLRASCSAAS